MVRYPGHSSKIVDHMGLAPIGRGIQDRPGSMRGPTKSGGRQVGPRRWRDGLPDFPRT